MMVLLLMSLKLWEWDVYSPLFIPLSWILGGKILLLFAFSPPSRSIVWIFPKQPGNTLTPPMADIS